jgi:V/A-type H+/Na+-transporting ATPase subunit C
MAEEAYIYAVARIRSQEQRLLNGPFMEQLLAAPDEAGCLRLLAERGWESPDGTTEAMLEAESQKTWQLMSELVKDPSVFDVFRYAADYHNLKAAVKQLGREDKLPGVFRTDGTVPPETIAQAVGEMDYSILPERMRESARLAADTFLQTHDGQLTDCIVDKAALEAIRAAGEATHEELLELYAELTVVTADIKTAVRAQRTGKDRNFLLRSLAACKTLDIALLADAAQEGFDAVCAYLDKTEYADAVPELKKSPAAFERWCDNVMMRAIRPQIHNPFGLGPLAAFILARENEIRTVRMILAGKRNKLSADSIRERVRETYV